jgi:hypothetical protein
MVGVVGIDTCSQKAHSASGSVMMILAFSGSISTHLRNQGGSPRVTYMQPALLAYSRLLPYKSHTTASDFTKEGDKSRTSLFEFDEGMKIT